MILGPYKEVKVSEDVSGDKEKLRREVLRLKRQMNALSPSSDDHDETPISADQFDAKATSYARQVAMLTFSSSHDEIETRPIPEGCYEFFDANEELYVAYAKLRAEVDKLEKSVGTPCAPTTGTREAKFDVLTQSITAAVYQVSQKLRTLQSSIRTAMYPLQPASTAAQSDSTAKDSENEEQKTSLCNSFKDNRYRMNLLVDSKNNLARSEQLVNYVQYFTTN